MDWTVPVIIISLSLPVGVAGWFIASIEERRQRDLNYREELRTMRFKPDFQAGSPPAESGGIEGLLSSVLSNPAIMNAIVSKMTEKPK